MLDRCYLRFSGVSARKKHLFISETVPRNRPKFYKKVDEEVNLFRTEWIIKQLMNRTIARWRHFTTTTRIIEFLVFLCKLRLLFFLVLSGIDKFKQQSKTEMNSGSCSQISSHPRRPRGSHSGREKRRHESFHYGRNSPWVPTLTELFRKTQADTGSWLGTKNALYYYAQSANSCSWVLFVISYTSAIVSPHLPGSLTKLVRTRETFIF